MAKEPPELDEEERRISPKLIIVVVVPAIIIIGVSAFILTQGTGETGGGTGGAGQAPTASFTYSPSSPTAGATVQFTDTSADPDGMIVSWSWSFGDTPPTTSNLQNPSHVYSSPGAYIVRLTVTDNDGNTNSYNTTITVTEGPTGNVFQDFESGNGTTGDYFQSVYNATPSFETTIVHGGSRSAKAVVEQWGSIRIMAASAPGYLDLSSATSFSIWVYDPWDHTNYAWRAVQLRLKDSDGDGGSGDDNNFLWSTAETVKDTWTKITWNLNNYPSVPNLDLDRIAAVELYTLNYGTFYYDDLTYS